MIDFACKEFKVDDVIKCSFGLTRTELSVLRNLMKDTEWIATDSLSRNLSVDLTTAQRAVKKLYENGLLERRQLNLEGGGYQYVYRSAPKKQVQDKIIEVLESWISRAEKHIRAW